MDPKEEWKTIPGFSSYEVSNYGLIYSLKTKRLLCLRPDEVGYFRTEIQNDNGEILCPRIHVLLMSAFIGPKPYNLTVNHKNGIKNDNRLNNLEYVTKSENILHAYRTGLKTPIRGDDHVLTKIPDSEIPKIMLLYNSKGLSMKKIGKMYGVSKTPIRHIIRGIRKISVSSSLLKKHATWQVFLY